MKQYFEPLFSVQPKELKAKMNEPAYFDIWLVRDCEVKVESPCPHCIKVIENFATENRINYCLVASKAGEFEVLVEAKAPLNFPDHNAPSVTDSAVSNDEPLSPDENQDSQEESDENDSENGGIAIHELIINGTESKPADDEANDNAPSVTDSASAPNIVDSAFVVPATPITPYVQYGSFKLFVEIVRPKELEMLCKLFPELEPTMVTQEDLANWEATMKKVKCIYQEFAQPKTECEAYPLLVLTAHYGVINGLGASVGITRADGVVASSSVGDVSVSFQTQPYGNNEFTYFLGLTKYGLEFLAWLNRRSGLYYAN